MNVTDILNEKLTEKEEKLKKYHDSFNSTRKVKSIEDSNKEYEVRKAEREARKKIERRAEIIRKVREAGKKKKSKERDKKIDSKKIRNEIRKLIKKASMAEIVRFRANLSKPNMIYLDSLVAKTTRVPIQSIIDIEDKKKKISKNKEQEHIVRDEQAAASSVSKPIVTKTKRESGVSYGKDRSGSRMRAMVRSAIDPIKFSYLDFLLGSHKEKKGSIEGNVDFLKMDSKIKTKIKKVKSDGKTIEKKFVNIEVKHSNKKSPILFAEVVDIRFPNMFETFKEGIINHLEKKGVTIKEENKNKVTKQYFMKLYNQIKKDSESKKKSVINRIYTHMGTKEGTSFLSIGKGNDKVTAPFTRKYVKIFMDTSKDKERKFSTKTDITFPRINFMVQFTEEGLNYKGPVAENNLIDFTREILNG